jgi:hypothetical protein
MIDLCNSDSAIESTIVVEFDIFCTYVIHDCRHEQIEQQEESK